MIFKIKYEIILQLFSICDLEILNLNYDEKFVAVYLVFVLFKNTKCKTKI